MMPADLPVRLGLGAIAGLGAAVVMDWPMSRQPEGFTPAYVAAAVVLRSDPDATSFQTASAVHHAAGLFAGVLYALVGFGIGTLVPPIAVVGRTALVPHLLAVLIVTLFIYVFFANLVLPRAGDMEIDRATAVRGQWLRSTVIFGAAMLILPVAIGALI